MGGHCDEGWQGVFVLVNLTLLRQRYFPCRFRAAQTGLLSFHCGLSFVAVRGRGCVR